MGKTEATTIQIQNKSEKAINDHKQQKLKVRSRVHLSARIIQTEITFNGIVCVKLVDIALEQNNWISLGGLAEYMHRLHYSQFLGKIMC